MFGLLGKKVGMTRVFEDGRACAVTVLEVGPCLVTAVRSKEKDGYDAVQIGFEDVDGDRLKKPQQGAFEKAKLAPKKHLREFRLDGGHAYEQGQTLTVSVFTPGELVDVRGRGKGRGFQGVVKRFGYRGGPAAHGSTFHRAPGSNGANTFPAKVWKGKGHPGHMGDAIRTIGNLRIVAVDAERNLLLVEGGVTGAPGTMVEIYKQGS